MTAHLRQRWRQVIAAHFVPAAMGLYWGKEKGAPDVEPHEQPQVDDYGRGFTYWGRHEVGPEGATQSHWNGVSGWGDYCIDHGYRKLAELRQQGFATDHHMHDNRANPCVKCLGGEEGDPRHTPQLPKGRFGFKTASELCPTCGVDHTGDSPEMIKAMHSLADTLSKPYTSPDKEPGWKPEDSYGGYISQTRDGKLLTDGKPTEKLYRVVHPKEWDDAQQKGYLQSTSPMSPGYTRASAKPDERWRHQSADPAEVAPRGYTLEIDYHPEDKWHASAEGYAATHAKIPLHRVRRVG